MPDVRPLPHVARRYYPLQYVLLGLCLLSFAVVFFRAADRDAWFFAALAVLIVSTAGCFVSDRLLIRSIPCPQCGARLPRTRPPFGKHISVQFHCPACDIIWDADAQPPPRTRYSDPL
ncbi:MAG: hypothetical protein ACK4PI_06290 [Tepidisphaerales bacterium]